jgi:hypothetical protein
MGGFNLNKRLWYKWPSGYYEKNWKPLYAILWVLATAPLVYGTFALFYVSVLISHGVGHAEEIREDLF